MTINDSEATPCKDQVYDLGKEKADLDQTKKTIELLQKCLGGTILVEGNQICLERYRFEAQQATLTLEPFPKTLCRPDFFYPGPYARIVKFEIGEVDYLTDLELTDRRVSTRIHDEGLSLLGFVLEQLTAKPFKEEAFLKTSLEYVNSTYPAIDIDDLGTVLDLHVPIPFSLETLFNLGHEAMHASDKSVFKEYQERTGLLKILTSQPIINEPLFDRIMSIYSNSEDRTNRRMLKWIGPKLKTLQPFNYSGRLKNWYIYTNQNIERIAREGLV